MNRRTPLLVCCSIALLMNAIACHRPKRVEKNQPVQTEPGTPSAARLKTSDVRVADPLYHDSLLRGFFEGDRDWRWTARQFAVALDVPPPLDAPTDLEIDFSIPSELIDAVHEVTFTARVNGGEVGKRKYTHEERETRRFPVPATLLKTSPAVVEGDLDRWGKDPTNGRDIGLIVVGLSLKHPDTTVLGHDDATETARQGYEQLLKRRQFQMSDAQQKEMMKLFHKIPIWSHMWFHNVPIGKNPLDLWMMQQIIYEIQPEFIVETGTFAGGSALYWAHTLNGLGLEHSRVFTMDIDDYTGTAVKHPLWKKYVTFWKGSSTDPAIVAEIAKQVKGHKTLVTLDSDHSMQHVLNELHAYSPMVSRGSYLIVEDTHIDGVPTQPNSGPGPMAAVLQFLKEGGSKSFEQDLSREALVMTFNPGGWLRRK